MKLGWLSDTHLNFLGWAQADRFVASLATHRADAWLVTGDIATACTLVDYLRLFAAHLPVTTYFTLGNHDFYGSSIGEVEHEILRLVGESKRLVWLNAAGPQVLDDHVAITGDHGWGDTRFGNALTTEVMLNDFYRIADLKNLQRPDLVRVLNRLGEEAAARLEPKIELAAQTRARVVVGTHVPPFREAAWHEGRHSDDEWAPWFTCRATGEVITDCALRHPEVSFLVLCGHTHGAGVFSPLPNLVVHTAAAEYGAPCVQRVFHVDRQTPAGS